MIHSRIKMNISCKRLYIIATYTSLERVLNQRINYERKIEIPHIPWCPRVLHWPKINTPVTNNNMDQPNPILYLNLIQVIKSGPRHKSRVKQVNPCQLKQYYYSYFLKKLQLLNQVLIVSNEL
jgi:hypothetical protein